jgi:molybdopterin-guanine dinucleotide biosynthesis protein A
MGAAKHALDHPEGGTWGAHLVRVFGTVFPGAPIQVLGKALADRPELPLFVDPREGPGRALRAWAASPVPHVGRWWVVACDQVRWTPERLHAWAALATAADPACERWILAEHGGRLQPLGGWLPACLRPAIQGSDARSLTALAQALPHLILPCEGPEWLDVDTPEERIAFEGRS